MSQRLAFALVTVLGGTGDAASPGRAGLAITMSSDGPQAPRQVDGRVVMCWDFGFHFGH